MDPATLDDLHDRVLRLQSWCADGCPVGHAPGEEETRVQGERPPETVERLRRARES